MDIETIKIFLMLIGGAAIGFYMYFDGFKIWRKKRLIQNTPKSKIRSLALGLVELNGKAKCYKEPFKAPFSGKECVFYKYYIERYHPLRISNKFVPVSFGGTFDIPFYVQDETGKVLIKPEKFNIDLNVKSYNETTINFNSNTIDFFNKKNIKYDSFPLAYCKLRLTEWTICEDDQIYVIGTVKKHKFSEEEYIYNLNESAKKMGSLPPGFKEIDKNHDGFISINEWREAADNLKQQLIQTDELKNSLLSVAENSFVIVKGEEDDICIISDYNEEKLYAGLNKQSRVKIFAGAIIAISCILIFVFYIYMYVTEELLKIN